MAREIRWPVVMAQALGPSFQVIEESLCGRTTVFEDPEEEGRNGLAYFAPQKPRLARPRDHFARLQRREGEVRRLDGNRRRRRRAADRGRARSATGPDGAAPEADLVAPPPIEKLTEYAEMFEGGAEKGASAPGRLPGARRTAGVGFVDAEQFIRCSPLDGIHYAPDQHAVLAATMAEAARMMLE